jgi:hypothetical protein
MSEKPKEDEEKSGSWPELNFFFFGFQQLFINRYDIIAVLSKPCTTPLACCHVDRSPHTLSKLTDGPTTIKLYSLI